MKIRLLSDLHLEHYPFEPPACEADVVVLAGDIGPNVQGLEWAARHFDCPVLYVPGNHEYYGEQFDAHRARMRKTAQALGVHLLDDASVDLNGVRFFGATMWTDWLLFGPGEEWFARNAARRSLSDCFAIRDGKNAYFTPEHSAQLHADSAAWLARELAAPFAGPRVVVTHHLPSMQSVPMRFRRDQLSAAFASNLEPLAAQASLWLHGHTHDACDYQIGDCRVVCNPRGYPGEQHTGFDPVLCVEVAPPAQ